MQKTITFKNPVYIQNVASQAGPKEGCGPLRKFFDAVSSDPYFKQSSWEKAESTLLQSTLELLLKKERYNPSDIDMIAGGDLLNQCVGTNYGLSSFEIPFLGLYGACSTFVEGLMIASMTISGGFAEKAVAVTSSHFCSSERQFRFPLEYGGQRPPTSQWTVTGSGAALISRHGDFRITHATIGRICDYGITDINNMGAAMAPAAIETVSRHFKDRNLPNDYFDLVVTGDLGMYGKQITQEQLNLRGIDLTGRYTDCGDIIFDKKTQDVHAGGSGCGCCASVFCGYLWHLLNSGKVKRMLLCATGALMSPTSCFQGESIPGIAHAVAIEREDTL
ncbi:MAG: stage V sporulation protein AD [Clostridia bacterium]|nr:stage V sporulation protein AD [Clostridia bacterium]